MDDKPPTKGAWSIWFVHVLKFWDACPVLSGEATHLIFYKQTSLRQ